MPKSVKAALEEHAPWKPPDYTESQVVAMQALARGEANDGQQKMALDWIINECCRTYDMSYRPDNIRDTDFAEGMRHVGNSIIKMVKIKVGALQKKERQEKQN